MSRSKLAVIGLAVLVSVAILVIVAPMTLATPEQSGKRPEGACPTCDAASKPRLESRHKWARRLAEGFRAGRHQRLARLVRALEEGTIVRVNATISDIEPRMIVLEADSGRTGTLVVPPVRWVANGEAYTWFELIAENVINEGDSVTATILAVPLGNSSYNLLILVGLTDYTTGYNVTPMLPITSTP